MLNNCRSAPPATLPSEQQQEAQASTCGLVKEQDCGLVRQCTGNGHPLLLSTRQLGREVIQTVTCTG